MNNLKSEMSGEFLSLLEDVPRIGEKHHSRAVVEHAVLNLPDAGKTLRDLPKPQGKKAKSAIVISAGPSVHRQKSLHRIRDSGFEGSLIAVDGSYVSCLKAGLVPDYVVSVDPHPTRMVRWFGDPNFEENSRQDDYFARQDLDVDFRANSIKQNLLNIDLVNQNAAKTKAIIASTSPPNMVERLKAAGFPIYWWNPLMDDPTKPDSLTRKLYNLNKFPCINTGGNVGTSAWVFATATLKIPTIALTGMDLGYYHDTPLKLTQTYYELADRQGTTEGIEKFFVESTFPLTGEKYYTDPTYAWYKKSFFELYDKSLAQTFNCTEGGTLFGENLQCISLDDFFQRVR